MQPDQSRQYTTPRPGIGQWYVDGNGTRAEVRATSQDHVVCDQERVFSRENFNRRFRPEN